jgi:hypothetical protein
MERFTPNSDAFTNIFPLTDSHQSGAWTSIHHIAEVLAAEGAAKRTLSCQHDDATNYPRHPILVEIGVFDRFCVTADVANEVLWGAYAPVRSRPTPGRRTHPVSGQPVSDDRSPYATTMS